MEFFRELRELRGNQEREEEEGVVFVEPITWIVQSALQDLLESITPESNANSSAASGSNSHNSSSSRASSSGTVLGGRGEGRTGGGTLVITTTEESVPMMGVWENMPFAGKLNNIWKAQQDMLARFKFKATLHHEVVDGVATVKGMNKLEAVV
ncbi:hypothetical protein SLEP1_g39482 [Rubroshorea leprosula]|uniref:Uncharacterized protein n=1 Tax=Rubroshorea leprosula TaxID=152421 RepID=A0AAV5L0J6_9ROSI|nr:hypothetical protein SLEP1_g39482 [Rubroshorea leprosula]